MPARVPLLFGTGLFGFPDSPMARTTDPAEAQRILDTFFAHGYNGLDSARSYGTSEAFITQLDLKNGRVDTKIHPDGPGGHTPENLRKTFQETLDLFKPHGIKVRVLYLHWPDRSTPFEETIAEIDKMHKEGLFEEFGLSNYYAWEVAQIWTLCKEKGYVLPTVYQGNYNLLVRNIEPELIPCLKKFGIRFIAWNPLAGGFLTGKFLEQADLARAEKGGRFDPTTHLGAIWTEFYKHEDNYKAMRLLKAAADKENLTLIDVALRWLQHHSSLTPADGIILGASNIQQLENNMAVSERGPLPDSILPAIDEAWGVVAPHAKKYWF